jgi:hypothetical protein
MKRHSTPPRRDRKRRKKEEAVRLLSPTGHRDKMSGLTMFLRDRNLCWAEIGNEKMEDGRRRFVPFEESRFYEIPKALWNTAVPWKDSIWSGGVLLIVPTAGNEGLVQKCEEQFRKMKKILERPIYHFTQYRLLAPNVHKRETLYNRFIQLVTDASLDKQALNRYEAAFPYKKDLKETKQLVRQYYLAKRLKITDCVFYYHADDVCVPRPLKRIPADCIGGTFFSF